MRTKLTAPEKVTDHESAAEGLTGSADADGDRTEGASRRSRLRLVLHIIRRNPSRSAGPAWR